MKVGVLATTLAILLVGGPVLAGPATDSDSDGTFDVLDGCSADPSYPSPNSSDTDNDGFGNVCDPDFNNDGLTNSTDFNDWVNECFLVSSPPSDPMNLGCDFNDDGVINSTDFTDWVAVFNLGFPANNPGPSGLPCAGTVPCP